MKHMINWESIQEAETIEDKLVLLKSELVACGLDAIDAERLTAVAKLADDQNIHIAAQSKAIENIRNENTRLNRMVARLRRKKRGRRK